MIRMSDDRCRCFQMPHERGDRRENCRYSLTETEEALFKVVRPYCADTREKRDWPRIADEQAVKIVLALTRDSTIAALLLDTQEDR